MTTSIQTLPNEILVQIFSNCSLSNLTAIAQVCKRWKAVSLTNGIWRPIAERKFELILEDGTDARLACLRAATEWRKVPKITLPLLGIPDQKCYSRPGAASPQFVSETDEGLALYNSKTFDQIWLLEEGHRPIGWYNHKFYCHIDDELVAWTPDTGDVHCLRLNALKRRDRALHIGLWKGRPSVFFGASRPFKGNWYLRHFAVCSLAGDSVERLCELPERSHYIPPHFASSPDGRYLACRDPSVGATLYCFDTSTGHGWTHDIDDVGYTTFAFIGHDKHCFLLFGASKPRVYSAATGQSMDLEIDFPESVWRLRDDFLEHPEKWESDRKVISRFICEITSVTIPRGSFLFAFQTSYLSVRSATSNNGWKVEAETEHAWYGFYCGHGQGAPVALAPLTITSKQKGTVNWHLVPSENSCRVHFVPSARSPEVRDTGSFISDYEIQGAGQHQVPK